MKHTYVAVDLETTGLNPRQDAILEIGAVKIIDGKPAGEFSTFVNCGRPVPPFITELTGIDSDMAAGGLETEEALGIFIDFCGDCDILGHNILFDFSFLKRNAVNHGIAFDKNGIDTLKIAKKFLTNLPSRRLESLCSHYGILQEKKHRAYEDAHAASCLYQKLADDFEELCPQEFEAKPLIYRVKREGPITRLQKVYLIDLAKYHRIDLEMDVDTLTKNEASRMIDRIIAGYGRIKR